MPNSTPSTSIKTTPSATNPNYGTPASGTNCVAWLRTPTSHTCVSGEKMTLSTWRARSRRPGTSGGRLATRPTTPILSRLR